MLPETDPQYMLKHHIPECIEIDQDLREEHWSRQDFLSALAELQWCCRVVEFDDEIWGYVIYSLNHDSIVIERLQVRRCYMRTGLQEELLSFLRMRLNHQRRSLVRIIPEEDLSAQLWYRSQGFRFEEVAQKYYSAGSCGSAYLMRYHKDAPVRDVVLNEEDTLVGI